MDHRDPAAAIEMRMRIGPRHPAVGGPTRVPEADVRIGKIDRGCRYPAGLFGYRQPAIYAAPTSVDFPTYPKIPHMTHSLTTGGDLRAAQRRQHPSQEAESL